MTAEEKNDMLRILKEKGLVADTISAKAKQQSKIYEKKERSKMAKDVNKEKEVKAVDVEKANLVKEVVFALEKMDGLGGVAFEKATVFVRGQEADFEIKVVQKKDRLDVFGD